MISVVVPAYNAGATIGNCLVALHRQTIPHEVYEVIVVDDGSTDGTATLAEQYPVRVLRSPHQGRGAARNLGAAAARGDSLLFTDADCVPLPDWVEQMDAAFRDPDVAGAKGVYRTRQPGLVARFVQQEYEEKYDRMRQLSVIDFVDTYSAGYRRDVFEESGGFDTDLARLQDQELSFRVAARGYRLVFAPDAAVDHCHPNSVFKYLWKKLQIGYWKVEVMRRHPSKLMRDSHTPQVLKLQMVLAGLGTLLVVVGLFEGRLALYGLAAWGGLLLSAVPFLVKVWRRDRAVMLVGPVLLFVRAWALGLGFLLGSVRWLRKRP